MAIDVVVGLVAAFALTRLMSSLLFGIGPLDAPTYLAALGVLLAAPAFASYVALERLGEPQNHSHSIVAGGFPEMS